MKKKILSILTAIAMMASVSTISMAASVNIVANGDFEGGWSGWTQYGTVTNETAYEGSNSMQVTTSKWPTQAITLEANTDYEVSLYAKGEGSTVFFVGGDNTAATRVLRLEVYTPGSDWKNYTAEFNSGSYTSAQLYLITTANSVYLDNISITKKVTEEPTVIYGDELMTNGTFEAAWSGWDDYGIISNDCAHQGTYSMQTNTGKYPYKLVTLEPNTNYEYKVYVKGSGSCVAFIDATDGTRLMRLPLTAGDDWSINEFSFNSGAYGSVKVHFITTAGSVYLDDVSLRSVKEKEADPTPTPTPEPSSANVTVTDARAEGNTLVFTTTFAVEGAPEITAFGSNLIPLDLLTAGKGTMVGENYSNANGEYEITDGTKYETQITDIPEKYSALKILAASYAKVNGEYVWAFQVYSSLDNPVVIKK